MPDLLLFDPSQDGSAMTVSRVAAVLRVSERHVYKLVEDGQIPYFKVGKSVRFDPEKLRDWVKTRMNGANGRP